MGLRIIERHLGPKGELTESERLRELELEMARWAEARAASPAQQAAFLTSYRRVRNRLPAPASMELMAERVHDTILNRNNDSALPHNQVDIATLLELL
jgi:hypothetical protein